VAIRLQIVFVLITFLSILAVVFTQSADKYFVFETSKVLSGEVWRVLTCHLCHTNWLHLGMNLLGLALLLGIFDEEFNTVTLIQVLGVSALAIALGYVVFYPADTRYLGLSGVLHGVAGAGSILVFKSRRLFAILFLLGLTIKILSEYTLGASQGMAEMIQARVATEAHLMGVLAGVAYGIGAVCFTRSRQGGC